MISLGSCFFDLKRLDSSDRFYIIYSAHSLINPRKKVNASDTSLQGQAEFEENAKRDKELLQNVSNWCTPMLTKGKLYDPEL